MTSSVNSQRYVHVVQIELDWLLLTISNDSDFIFDVAYSYIVFDLHFRSCLQIPTISKTQKLF